MSGWAAQLISQEVADKVGKCWALGSGTTMDPGPCEGGLRHMWKPTALANRGSTAAICTSPGTTRATFRLQLKAREAGMDVHVYGQAPVHHLQ